MDAKEKIVESQRAILDRLVALESMIGQLYGMYGRALPEHEAFWKTIAQEERSHAAMLATLNKQIDQGYVLWNLGKCSVSMILDELATIEAALNAVMVGSLTHHEAVLTAIDIEKSVLESSFYEVVTSEAPGFDIIMNALAQATGTHIKRIQQELSALD